MSAAWTDRVLYRPEVAAMLDADPVVDLADCSLVSVTTDGGGFEPAFPGGLPRWLPETVAVEVATPAAAGQQARLVRFVGTGTSSYAVVGVLDGRPGALRVDLPRPRSTDLAFGGPERVWLSFHAEQTRLRIKVDVLELDSVRTDLATPSSPRVESRISCPSPARMTVASCAAGDIDGPLQLALTRRPGWTRDATMTFVERLCAALDVDYELPDGDEEWIVLLHGSPGPLPSVAIMHLFTPLLVFTDAAAEQKAHDRTLVPPEVVTIGVPGPGAGCMRADIGLIDQLTRSTDRDETTFDDELFSADDLWFEGT